MNMQQLIHAVIALAESWGIYDQATAEAQKLLTYSEVGELADELTKGNMDKAEMELGDVIVTRINYCHMKSGCHFEEAVLKPYPENYTAI